MEKQRFIETPLPIVYREGNQLTVNTYLDLEKLKGVFGVLLDNGVILSVHYYGGSTYDWAKGFIEEFKRDHDSAHMAYAIRFQQLDYPKAMEDFSETLGILSEHMDHSYFSKENWLLDCGLGKIWLGDHHPHSYYAKYLTLNPKSFEEDEDFKTCNFDNLRIALEF